MEETNPRITIKSYKGEYSVYTRKEPIKRWPDPLLEGKKCHYIIDSKVAKLYKNNLSDVFNSGSFCIIEANEPNKSLDKFTDYAEKLISNGVKRGACLVAIGGGIIQDITCFIAATLFRGLDWVFYPTTLLAQADSCIGSKSSINVGNIKNLMGTFTPPKKVFISTDFLKTLDERDIKSGIGEMLKVHAIEGPASFKSIANDFDKLSESQILEHYIVRSLEIKKGIIEIDEFDQNIRNKMNYGHSFGHAIESTADFAVPHGIAVSIGCDMANFISVKYNLTDVENFERMHKIFLKNYKCYGNFDFCSDVFFSAIAKDKKNVDAMLSLILLNKDSKVEKIKITNDEKFKKSCLEFFDFIKKQ